MALTGCTANKAPETPTRVSLLVEDMTDQNLQSCLDAAKTTGRGTAEIVNKEGKKMTIVEQVPAGKSVFADGLDAPLDPLKEGKLNRDELVVSFCESSNLSNAALRSLEKTYLGDEDGKLQPIVGPKGVNPKLAKLNNAIEKQGEKASLEDIARRNAAAAELAARILKRYQVLPKGTVIDSSIVPTNPAEKFRVEGKEVWQKKVRMSGESYISPGLTIGSWWADKGGNPRCWSPFYDEAGDQMYWAINLEDGRASLISVGSCEDGGQTATGKKPGNNVNVGKKDNNKKTEPKKTRPETKPSKKIASKKPWQDPATNNKAPTGGGKNVNPGPGAMTEEKQPPSEKRENPAPPKVEAPPKVSDRYKTPEETAGSEDKNNGAVSADD